MKPRLKLIGGLWRCSTLEHLNKKWHVATGFGLTPEEAYRQWSLKP